MDCIKEIKTAKNIKFTAVNGELEYKFLSCGTHSLVLIFEGPSTCI